MLFDIIIVSLIPQNLSVNGFARLSFALTGRAPPARPNPYL